MQGVRYIDCFFNDEFSLCNGSELVRSARLGRPFLFAKVSVQQEKNILGAQNRGNMRRLSMCHLELALSLEAQQEGRDFACAQQAENVQ